MDNKNTADTPLWEKMVGVIGFILLCIAIAVLVRNAISGDNSPPVILFENIQVTAEATGFRVDLDVVNAGGTSVADLGIEGHVTRSDGSLEVADVTFDYLPAHSRRTGGLFFASDPQHGALEIRAKSFNKP